MSDKATINTESREETGTLRMRRMRAAGKIPGMLYGRGDNVQLALDAKDVGNAVRQGSYIVQLAGAVNDSVLIKEIQWDPVGTDEVLHMDFTRVDLSEAVEVTLSLDFKGSAPGTKMGGTVSYGAREITISCPAGAIPDNIEISLNDLELDQSIKASDLSLPEGAELVSPEDQLLVQCIVVEEKDEEETAGDGPMEPEVIGQKKDDEGSDD
ncbi:MAG: 50S ribosomal protein L25 [Planctomycetota bacterium]